MKQQIPTIGFAIISIVLAVLYYSAKQETTVLKANLNAARSALELAADAEAAGRTAPEAAEEAIVVKSRGEAEMSMPSEEPAEAIADEEEAEKRRVMGSMAKMMMENPTMNKVMEASQRGAMSALYIDLIDYLKLNPDESNFFMDLLTHRQMKNVEAAMKIMGGGLSDEERLALMEEMKQTGAEVESEIEKFLNNTEDFEEFQFYEKTIGERMMLSQVDAKLAATDNALNDETYREVLDIMYEERQNFAFTDDLGDQKNTDFSADRFSQTSIDRYIEETLQLAEQIDSRLELILTPEQMEAYHESGKAMLDMHVGQLQQARQMFGGE